MKILAFAASNSRQSINKQLVSFAAHRFAEFKKDIDVEVLDLNDYEMPLYSIDRESESGIPQLAHDFLNKITQADLVMISFAEHNGNYTVAFKNIFDWSSRVKQKIFEDKNLIIMSAAPGPRGGKSVLDIAQANTARFGAEVKGVFSFPKFSENFDPQTQIITNDELLIELDNILKSI